MVWYIQTVSFPHQKKPEARSSSQQINWTMSYLKALDVLQWRSINFSILLKLISPWNICSSYVYTVYFVCKNKPPLWKNDWILHVLLYPAFTCLFSTTLKRPPSSERNCLITSNNSTVPPEYITWCPQDTLAYAAILTISNGNLWEI